MSIYVTLELQDAKHINAYDRAWGQLLELHQTVLPFSHHYG
jgi:hypothetical protein